MPEEGSLPDDVAAEAERLTRLARAAVDENEAEAYRERRDALLAEHGYRCRVRDRDGDATLVCYPASWLDEEGTVRPRAFEETDRAVERSLAGPDDPEDWDAVDAHNRDVARRVRDAHGDVHGDNAAAFADFLGNHYAKPVEAATAEETREFLEEYFVRNAWPTDEQRRAVERSVRLVFEATGTEAPL